MSSQPGLVSGCRLDYTSSAGAALMNITQLSSSSRIAVVSCDNQTISYTGTAYDSMLRALGCPRSGMAKCPPMKGIIYFISNSTILNLIFFQNTTGQNGSQDSGRCSNDKGMFQYDLYNVIRLQNGSCYYSVVPSQLNSAGLLTTINCCYCSFGTGSVGEDASKRFIS